MRVLVTGHKGYIGSVLVPMLLDAGHEVTGLDTDLYAACTFTGELPKVPEIRMDTRDVTLDRIRGHEAIIHLAGLSNDPLGDYDPSLTDAINRQASVRLARLGKEAGGGRFLDRES